MTEPTPDALNQIMEVANTLYHLIEEKLSIDLQFRRLELLQEEEAEWDDDTAPEVDILEMYMLQVQILKHRIHENREALLKAMPTLTTLLEKYGYLNRGVSTFAYSTPKHAVHPNWVEVYDIGLYHHESGTWDESLGEVPAYALIHLEGRPYIPVNPTTHTGIP